MFSLVTIIAPFLCFSSTAEKTSAASKMEGVFFG